MRQIVAKQGKSEHFERRIIDDKSTIRVPRQETSKVLKELSSWWF